MSLTVDRVLALAPDASAAAAGRKLGVFKPWKNLGRSERAIWGECQGSAVYRVSVDLGDLTTQCTCPSRKFPCKHALGLLLLGAESSAALATTEPPEWVGGWLAKRQATAQKKEAREAAAEDKPVDTAAQAKRADQRMARVTKGLDALDLWLSDLVRSGLAGVEARPAGFWEAQAARLVDAQAPALAARVRDLGERVGGDAAWPERLLDELGRIAMITHAFRRIDALPAPLQADVRRLVGWSLAQDEVIADGETVADEWIVTGQRIDDEGRMRVQRTWLAGVRSRRSALVLQFSAAGAPFAEVLLPGTAFEAELAYWPSASPQRALVRSRTGTARVWSDLLPGHDRVAGFLASVSDAAARLPWLDRVGACLRAVTPVLSSASSRTPGARVVRDADGDALRLAPVDVWPLLALSGGAPIDLAAEWDGDALVPLGAVVDGTYHALWKGAA